MASSSSSSRSPEEKEEAAALDVRNDDGKDADKSGENMKSLTRTQTKTLWKFKLRPPQDDDREDWWFASIAIPLLAATIGPLANVLSIAALVTSWRENLVVSGKGRTTELEGNTFSDPHWVYWPNLASLLTGYIGNLFLLANFTNRIRYIIALPVTIILWFISSGLLVGIIAALHIYNPPIAPDQTYSQGFWYGVIAATLYMICALILLVNMLGYMLGHYPQHFNLTESQRTMILQSMLFFIWLAGGAGVFASVEGEIHISEGVWDFSDALYFCDVTILTVGFGDLYPTTDVGRGLILPYSVGGIIMLGLMISSISTFAGELSHDKIIYKRLEKHRQHTMERSITDPADMPDSYLPNGVRPDISRPFDGHNIGPLRRQGTFADTIKRSGTTLFRGPKRSKEDKLHLLLEEKDRFRAMRSIQSKTNHFKNYTALIVSVFAFAILWAVGAVVFWQVEKNVQGMTYFEALYFCYVSLITVGYGDLAPKSNPGRPFFVVWSLLAVPTMTILINSMGNTIINKFKDATNKLADFTVLPQYGIWRKFLDRHPWLLIYVKKWADKRAAKKRLEGGFPVGPDLEESDAKDKDDIPAAQKTAEEIMKENEELSDQELAFKLSRAIRKTADDFKLKNEKKYTYEEWVEFTHLIRFTRPRDDEYWVEEDSALIEWDWIGESSPMMQEQTEAEFVLDRLCESMARYVKRQTSRSDSRDDSSARAKDNGQGASKLLSDEKVSSWDGTERG